MDVSQLKAASIDILTAANKAPEDEKGNVNSALQQAITELSKKAKEGDESAIHAITDIGSLSASKNIPGPTETAIREFKELQSTPSLSNELRTKVDSAASSLSMQINN